MAVKSLPGVAIAIALTPVAMDAAAQDLIIGRTTQLALERLQSGIAMTERLSDGTGTLSIRPLRTWKSVTGHFCREYELQVRRTGALPLVERHTRCRDSDGAWKLSGGQ